MSWDTIDDTWDWIADELSSRNNDTTCKQQNCCKYIMQSKHSVVRLDFLNLEVFFQASQKLIHFGEILDKNFTNICTEKKIGKHEFINY